jgi:hypothetical protein
MKLLMEQVLYFAVVVEAGLASILTTFKPEATVNTETGKYLHLICYLATFYLTLNQKYKRKTL